jgi:putative FmdB family regulatory protein
MQPEKPPPAGRWRASSVAANLFRPPRLQPEDKERAPMILYDFVCDQCENEFEDLVKDPRDARCPRCNSDKVTKLLSSFAIGGKRSEVPSCGSGFCGNGGCGN